MTVTLLDANHCPGAVMFLFDGHFGTVLYTGDFRYEENSEIFHAPIYEKLFSQHMVIDLLYVDNTYWNVDEEFPSREECIEEIKKLVNQWEYSDVYIKIQSKLGKEEILYSLADLLESDCCIHVTSDK